MTQEITPEARDVFLDSADALIESDGAREALATALAALSGIKTCQRSLLTGAEKNTTVIVTSRSGFRTKGTLFFFYKNLVYKNIKASKCSKIKNVVVILLVAISISFEGFKNKMTFL